MFMQPLVNIQGNIIDLSVIYKIDSVYHSTHHDGGKLLSCGSVFSIHFLNKKEIVISYSYRYDYIEYLKNTDKYILKNAKELECHKKQVESVHSQLVERWNKFKNSNSDLIIPEIKPII